MLVVCGFVHLVSHLKLMVEASETCLNIEP